MPAPSQRIAHAPRVSLAWVRNVRARTPLRVKLIATLLLLVVAALAISGAVAGATLRSYLVGRVDAQLASVQQPTADHRLGPSGGPGGDHDRGGGDDDFSRLPSAFVVEATDATGAVVYGPTSNLVNPGQPLPALPHLGEIRGKRYLTVGAQHGDERWRVLATPVQLSDGSTGTLMVAQSLQDVDNTVNRLLLLLLMIGAAAVVILAGVGYFIVRANLRPLREVERTAAKIAAGDLSRRVPTADPHTEVGQLSGALNTMLAEVETAFAARAASESAARRSEQQMRRSEAAARQSEDRMRRFVADASHELRTPLTSIRGFAELYRQGAATDDAEVRRFMTRIEDEAKRMGLLVEDLLLLARLDQERPLAQAPVDMLALAGDAVHDVRAIDASRPITFDVGSTDPPPVVIGDEARLRQVLSNLLANVVKHTPPGTPVHVRLNTGIDERTSEPAVQLVVADQGPGMTPESAARVFERFYRADAARSRSAGSTGLGLAIVAALVKAHGGTVDVQTAPGAGACFRVTLPLAVVAAERLG